MKTTDKAFEILEWPLILDALKSGCATSAGKSRADAAIPLGFDEVKTQTAKITALKNLSIDGFAPEFGGITDISPFLERAGKGSVLALEDLVAIKNFLLGAIRLKAFFREHDGDSSLFAEEIAGLPPCDKLNKELAASIDENGELSETRYPALRKLKTAIFDTKTEIEKKLSAAIASPAMSNALQEKFFTTCGSRYCLLVKASMKNKVNGTVIDISASGATFYIEPAGVRSLNDKHLMLERELEGEIEKILASLSLLTGEFSDDLSLNIKTAAYADFLNAAAKFSFRINGAAPEIAAEPVINLRQARHPLLSLMPSIEAVPNDIDLSDCRCLIVSGANTGGKTVLLKTIGCAALMLRMGLHIAASPDSKLGLFENIFADIGDDQNMQQSLSTFSGQITAINEMLSAADANTLSLVDEIIVGTNPRQGAALAQAVCEAFVRTGCLSIITTHYSELKELASADDGFKNASVAFDLNTLKPEYKLIMGLPGVSYALEIAENYGMERTIISRAKELTDAKELSVEALLEEAQRFKQETEQTQAELKREREIVVSQKQELAQAEIKLKAAEAQLKENKGVAFLDEIENWRRQAAARVRELAQANIKQAAAVERELADIENKALDEIKRQRNERLAETETPVNKETVKAGDKVYAASLGMEGVIDSVSPSKKFAVVLIGGTIRARFPMDTLYERQPAAKKQRKSPLKIESPAGDKNKVRVAIQTSFNTINLLGMRVAEALPVLDAGLDEMFRKGIDTVIVIHGHGTGALKQAVREHVKASNYAESFRQGEDGEGGDGVTIVNMQS